MYYIVAQTKETPILQSWSGPRSQRRTTAGPPILTTRRPTAGHANDSSMSIIACRCRGR